MLNWKPTRLIETLATTVKAGALAIGATAAATSLAYAFPDKPVTIVVPFAAGGTTDLAARTIGEVLSEKWGEPVVVENRPGAGNIIALSSVAQAPADGYTMLIAPDPALSVNPMVYSSLPYDVERDFQPVTTLVKFPLAVVVSAKLGVETLQEFIDLAKTKELNYGSFGPGTAPHLTMEVLQSAAGFTINHVPYNGAAPVRLAIQSGEVDATVMGLGSSRPIRESGEAVAVALDGDERDPLSPDTPSFAEAGYAEVKAPAWWAVLVPNGTPGDIVTQLNADIIEATKDERFKKFLENGGFRPTEDSPEDTATLIKDTTEYWRPVIEKIDLKLN